jgi:hypothetical protein
MANLTDANCTCEPYWRGLGARPLCVVHEDQDHEAEAERREQRRAYEETRAALHADLAFDDANAYEHGRGSTHE